MQVGDGRDSKRLMSEINVVPLVDVVLVLLIIFMITAPFLYRGIDINLPKSSTNTINSEERSVLTIERDGSLYLDKERIIINNLSNILDTLKKRNSEITLYLRADKDVPYGSVIEVMDIIKKSGIERLGMVTEPLQKSKRD